MRGPSVITRVSLNQNILLYFNFLKLLHYEYNFKLCGLEIMDFIGSITPQTTTCSLSDVRQPLNRLNYYFNLMELNTHPSLKSCDSLCLEAQAYTVF